MNIRIPSHKKAKNLEKIKWFFIIIIFITSIFINNILDKVDFFIRIFIMILLTSISIGIAIYTKQAKRFFLYINASKNEIKKMIFPQYKETLYTTLVIISVTVLMSLLLWGVDSIIFRFITFIISLRF